MTEFWVEFIFHMVQKKPPSEDGKGSEWWHQWPDPAITMVQYQKEGEPSNTMTIVYPEVYKTGDPIYVD